VSRSYDVVVGTGGLGTGIFLTLVGNHTLGREESRTAELLDNRDYCKLHIVCHYVQRLLGPTQPVVPIGKVGADEAGRSVRADMRAAGLDTSYVGVSARPTLFSVCFLYPDGDGGNLSNSSSASADVSAEDVLSARQIFETNRGRGVALALPEVPVATRAALLRLASEHDFFRVAALVTGEVAEVLASGLLADVDLVSVNIEEAAALGATSAEAPEVEVVTAAVQALREFNAAMLVVVTAGARGSWSWDGCALTHAPALDVDVVSSAGAGDAHLAALVTATIGGLQLAEANAFAGLVSAMSVASPHTINPDVDAASVLAEADRLAMPLHPALRQLLS
jgi:ribokinase